MKKSEEYLALEREEISLSNRLDKVQLRLVELEMEMQKNCTHENTTTVKEYSGDNIELCGDCGSRRYLP